MSRVTVCHRIMFQKVDSNLSQFLRIRSSILSRKLLFLGFILSKMLSFVVFYRKLNFQALLAFFLSARLSIKKVDTNTKPYTILHFQVVRKLYNDQKSHVL